MERTDLGRLGDACRICGTALSAEMDTLGRVLVRCAGCERRRSRRCMDCASPLPAGKSWRCERCRRVRRRRADHVHYIRHRGEKLAADHQRMAARTPEQRAHRAAQRKAWRARNKLRIKLTQKRKQRLEGRGGYATREAYLAYQQAYNARRAAQKREYMRQRAVLAVHAPVCCDCGAPVAFSGRGRPKARCEGCAALVHAADAPKRAAQRAVRRAVQRGKLARPSRCSRCQTPGTVQAHHRDYERPLDVVWLCPACHRGRHPTRATHALVPRVPTVRRVA